MADEQKAMDRRDMKLHEQSIRDLEYATFLFRENRSTMAWHLSAIAAYIEVSNQIGDQENTELYITSGEKRVEEALCGRELGSWRIRTLALLSSNWRGCESIGSVLRWTGSPGIFSLFTASNYLRLPRHGSRGRRV